MSAFARYIARVKDKLNPCKAYVDTTWITLNERIWQRKRSAMSCKVCKGCFQHRFWKKHGSWVNDEIDDDQTWKQNVAIRTERFHATTTKRMFLHKPTFKHAKSLHNEHCRAHQEGAPLRANPPVYPTHCNVTQFSANLKDICMHIHIQTYVYIYIYKPTNMQTYTNIHTYIHTYIRTFIDRYIQKLRTYIQIYVHTYRHRYIYRYT